MKKLIFLIVLTALMSCEKDSDRFCWDCYAKDVSTDAVIGSASYCDMTKEEIHNVTLPEIVPGYSYRVCYVKK